MQAQQTITFFGTASNAIIRCTSRTRRRYTAFVIDIIFDSNPSGFPYNIVAFCKQGHFAKQLQIGIPHEAGRQGAMAN